MRWPRKLTIHLFARARDGGSKTLYCSDEQGTRRRVELHQYMFLEHVRDGQPSPGRLHLDRHPLGLRSNDEKAMIELLRSAAYDFDIQAIFSHSNGRQTGLAGEQTAEGRLKAEEGLRESVAELIAFVESDAYVSVSERVDRADNGNRQRWYGGNGGMAGD